jgi:hypothetical protein
MLKERPRSARSHRQIERLPLGVGMTSGRHVQTLADAYQAIVQGALPWVALGDFLNEWFDYSREQREELVAEPVTAPLDPTSELHRWATFCAASAEWLCQQGSTPCPAWVHDPAFCLPERWLDAPQAHKPEVRTWLLQTTPEPFARRNIFCGDRVLATKYDFADQHRRSRCADES